MTNKVRPTNKFRPARVELFNEEFCNYNPLFIGQGDAPTHDMAFGMRFFPNEKAIAIDVGCLTGLDLGRVVNKFLGANHLADPDDLDPQLSPLTNQAKSIVDRVHRTLPNATAAYHNQINFAYNSIKTNKLNAAKVLEALSKKGVSPAIAIETFKMIERGVNASQIKNEVIDLVGKAVKVKPASVPKLPLRIIDIVKINTTPDYPSKGAAPTVSTREVATASGLIAADPVIVGLVKSSGTSAYAAAQQVAAVQVDQILATLASKALLDGKSQPTDSQVNQASTQQPPATEVGPPKKLKLSGGSNLLLIGGGIAVGLLVVSQLTK